MFTITISDKGGQQSRLEFSKPEVSIGRMKGNDVVLPKGNVSKRHARILMRGDSFYVKDTGSTNGTYINGRKVEVDAEQHVSGDDKIYIGDFILQLTSAERAGAGARSGPPSPPNPPAGNQPSQPMQGQGQQGGGANQGNRDTLFDPFSSDDGNVDPMRQTYTNPPEGSDPMRSSGPGNVPDDIRETVGATPEELQQMNGGSSGGRMYDSAGGFGNQPSPDAPNAPSGSPPPPANRAPSGPQQSPPRAASGPQPSAQRPQLTSPPQTGPESGPQQRAEPPLRPAEPAPTPEPAPSSPSSSAPPSSSARPMAGMSGAMSHLQLEAPQIVQEFDSEFFIAQVDLARLVFENHPVEDLPLIYPAMADDHDRYSAAIDEALEELNPDCDHEELKTLFLGECVELGPLDVYLEDPSVRDIYVNRYDQILLRRDGELVQGRYVFSTPETLTAVARRLLGDELGEVTTDEVRLGDGTRVHIVMPPLAVHGALVTIRKPPVQHASLQDLVGEDVLSVGMADFLMRAIDSGRSIAIAGPTSSGKTTMLSALAGLIHEGIRIISIEDYNHIELPQGSAVRLEASPAAGHDKRALLRNALAMHPQRLILDECRGAEAYDFVTAVASGTEGSMLSVHGTSAAEALGRMESLCLLGSHEVSPRGLREQIARAIDLVVVVNRLGEGGFRVQQIAEVQGVDLDSFRLNDIFYYRVEGAEGAFHPTGYIPLFFEDLSNAGVDVDFEIFQD